MFQRHHIAQTDSTSNVLKQLSATSSLPQGYTLYASYQSAGRGQQGNSWDSEPDKNLLFSTLFYPDNLTATQQFRLSMAVALQVVKTLQHYVPQTRIKWPNDIYVGDRKMGGMLIENQLAGDKIQQAVIGIGININQTVFQRHIPNPTSFSLLTGKTYNIEILLDEILTSFEDLNSLIADFDVLKQQYFCHLYRHEGYYPYRERVATAQPINIDQHWDNSVFQAKIVDIAQNGSLLLEWQNGRQKAYYFKEIQFIIPTEPMA